MTHDEFEALVGKLEQQAQRDPARYKLKVMLLALCGNAYLSAMLLFLIALFLGALASIMVLKAIGVKLAFIIGFFLWIILKALSIKLDPPTGVEVKAAQAPELFAMIDTLRRQLKAPRFHHVLITEDFNAAVAQIPRLGIFGWPRNYLILGLPLMKTLTVEQFKAVLAHEFGHLAKAHGRMSNYLYRQRLRWSRLLDTLEENESWGNFLFKPFLKWFAPYFGAYSFPLARSNEFEADATSVRLTSAKAAAEALTSVNVVGSYLAERYWPQIHKQADDHPAPAFAPYLSISQGVATELDEASARAWLDSAIERKTTSDDTHPALNDRLKAIGATPRLFFPAAQQAADLLLGNSLRAITDRFDLRWKESIAASWEARHKEVQQGRGRLAELNQRLAEGEALDVKDAYERALLTEKYGNDADDALTQLRALHERDPQNIPVSYSLGVRLLSRDDPEGVPLIEHAIQADDSAIAPGSEALRDYHWRKDDKELAQQWHQRLIERLQLQQAAADERNQVTLRDKYDHHDLSDEVMAELRAQLQNIPQLRKAYIVKKRVQHFPNSPLYVLGCTATAWWQFQNKKRVTAAVQRIHESLRFPGETFVISVEGDYYKFGRRFKKVKGARVL